MNTRKIIIGLLLLVTATSVSGVFAQSAEEAAKYGQLQEIQLSKAGQLSKFIKKNNPNVTALKLSGELNEKDLAVLFSLPNIAYLDLADANNIATTYVHKGIDGKNEFEIYENEFMLLCGNSLKYLVAPKNKSLISVLPDTNYELDWFVVDSVVLFINHGNEKGWRKAENITIQNVKMHTINDNEISTNLSENIAKIYDKTIYDWYDYYYDGYVFGASRDLPCKTLYVVGNGNSIPTARKDRNGATLYNIFPQDIIIESTGEKMLNFYQGEEKYVDISDYDRLLNYAFYKREIEQITLGDKITVIPRGCFDGCKNLVEITMPKVTTIERFAFSHTKYYKQNKFYI